MWGHSNILDRTTVEYRGIRTNIEPSITDRLYSKESDTYFLIYIMLAGYAKEDFDIEEMLEKDFITITITFKKVLPLEDKIKSNIVIVKTKDLVDNTKGIEVSISNGLLLVSFPKKYPIIRKELKI